VLSSVVVSQNAQPNQPERKPKNCSRLAWAKIEGIKNIVLSLLIIHILYEFIRIFSSAVLAALLSSEAIPSRFN
jgi:hypothetical protein